MLLTAYLFTGLGFALNDILAEAELPDDERCSVLETLVIAGIVACAWPVEVFMSLRGRG